MLKDLGPKPFLFPMPVLLLATYDENKKVNVMNMAWGGIYGDEKVVLDLDPSHKSYRNIKLKKSFTLSVADIPHLKEADYFGIVSGNKDADKFERTGLRAAPSSFVDAPILLDFPISLECSVLEIVEEKNDVHIVGRILNTLADDRIFDETGKIDATKIQAFVYDTFQHNYYAIGEKVGKAFSDGRSLAEQNK